MGKGGSGEMTKEEEGVRVNFASLARPKLRSHEDFNSLPVTLDLNESGFNPPREVDSNLD